MSRSQALIDKSWKDFEKSGWTTSQYGIRHATYGNLNFNFNNFVHCCGAQEMGRFNFTVNNKEQCVEALKNHLAAYRRSLLLATVNDKQDSVKDVLLKVGFELLDNLKFKNKNSGRTVEVLCLRDRPFRRDKV